jgi:hypothetical protein
MGSDAREWHGLFRHGAFAAARVPPPIDPERLWIGKISPADSPSANVESFDRFRGGCDFLSMIKNLAVDEYSDSASSRDGGRSLEVVFANAGFTFAGGHCRWHQRGRRRHNPDTEPSAHPSGHLRDELPKFVREYCRRAPSRSRRSSRSPCRACSMMYFASMVRASDRWSGSKRPPLFSRFRQACSNAVVRTRMASGSKTSVGCAIACPLRYSSMTLPLTGDTSRLRSRLSLQPDRQSILHLFRRRGEP